MTEFTSLRGRLSWCSHRASSVIRRVLGRRAPVMSERLEDDRLTQGESEQGRTPAAEFSNTFLSMAGRSKRGEIAGTPELDADDNTEELTGETLWEAGQDSVGRLRLASGRSAIAVADGVSAGAYSSLASRAIIKAFFHLVSTSDQKSASETCELLRTELHNRFVDIFNKLAGENQEAGLSAATTFVGIVNLDDQQLVAVKADGSVYRYEIENGVVLNDTVENFAEPLLLGPPPQLSPANRVEIEFRQKVNRLPVVWLIATDGLRDFRHAISPGERVEGSKAGAVIVNQYLARYNDNREPLPEDNDPVLLGWVKRCQRDDDASLALMICANGKTISDSKAFPMTIKRCEGIADE